MSQAPAKGVAKLRDVLTINTDDKVARDTFMIQHPTDDTLFLRLYNKEPTNDTRDEVLRKWDVLPAKGTEENNEKIIRQYMFIGGYINDEYGDWAGICTLPAARGNDLGETGYTYLINPQSQKIVYWWKDTPNWGGGNNDDRFNIDSSVGKLKFRNGRYFSMSGNSATNTESGAIKCRFLKVRNLTAGNFTAEDGETMGDGASKIVDFAKLVDAENRRDAITYDWEQDHGPCGYNTITTELEGSENCSKYYGISNRYPLTDGSTGELAPGADVILPTTNIPSMGEHYDINRYVGDQKFEFKVFYFTDESSAGDVLKRYIDKGGNQAIDNITRKDIYNSISSKVCSYDDNVLYEFKGPDDENMTCDQVINNNEQVINTCISNAAIRMNTSNACTRSKMGEERWQTATDRYCNNNDVKISDPRCKMYLAYEVANVDSLCGEDSNVWTEQCKELMEAKQATIKQFKKDKKKGSVLSGMSESAYINDSLSREFYEKWKSQHPDWKPKDFVLPDVNFCQQNIDVRQQNAALDAACKIETSKTSTVTGAEDDGDGAPIDGTYEENTKEATEERTLKLTQEDNKEDNKGGTEKIVDSDNTFMYIVLFILFMIFVCGFIGVGAIALLALM